MDELKKLVDVCNAFKSGKSNIKEFQMNIETVCLPDECKHTLEKEQHNACNRLEEIIYCYNESQKKHADNVADNLIQATLLEQKRIEAIKI